MGATGDDMTQRCFFFVGLAWSFTEVGDQTTPVLGSCRSQIEFSRRPQVSLCQSGMFEEGPVLTRKCAAHVKGKQRAPASSC